MSREEAENLIRHKEGRLCVRYVQRHDGTVITRDCQGLLRRKIRPPALIVMCMVCAALLAPLVLIWCSAEPGHGRRAGGLRSIEPFRTIMDWIDPPPVFMGAMPARPLQTCPTDTTATSTTDLFGSDSAR
jgi:hypothetical protein